jgi:uroporphyrinogen decarboxylase
MTKRDAVLKALNHQYVEPIPYFLDLGDETEQRMIEYTGDPAFFLHSGSYLAQERNESFLELGDKRFLDMFGVEWNRCQEGDFGIVSRYPILDTDFGDYRFPEPDETLIREKCERLLQQQDKFTMYIIGFSLFERAWTLHSMENVLCDFLLEPDFMHALLDKIVEYNLKVIEIVAQYPIDCIFFGDDWGQQQGLIMGYPTWKTFLYPRLKILYDAVKKHGMFVAQHSCGDCREVFPDLVELGLDIYNTFQPEVYDIVDFKRRFGASITFFGGISTQRLLPVATPDEVKKEMHRIMDIMAVDGGYILAPTHAMPGDIPSENVMAFLEVCQNENPH